jgi:DNA-binding NarL/FixJ family response regulator
MKFDIWIVAAGFKQGAEQVARLLDGQPVAIVSQQELNSLNGPSDSPAVLVAVTDSWSSTSKEHLKRVAQHASLLPVVVIDQSFNTRIARQLAVQNVQDYLGLQDVSADRLAASLEGAIIRHGHHAVRSLLPLIAARPDLEASSLREIMHDLSPSEREVFDLLITCLPTDELAARLGKSPQTIRNQIAALKQRFAVHSREDLVVISILCLPET